MNSPILMRWQLVVLMTMQAIALLLVAWNTGPGWDEWGHLPSGLFAWQYGDHSPYCVNPPFTKLWCAIPVWLAGGGIGFEPLPRTPGFRAEALLAATYVEQQRERVFTWIALARTAAIPIALYGTHLIWRIGFQLFSGRVAIIAAILWAFSPTVLTFGACITPDVTAAVLGLLATWHFYLWLRIGTLKQAVWLGLTVGLAILSKATWLLLPSILLSISLAYGLRYRNRWDWTMRTKQTMLVACLCWLTIHWIYEFEGTFVPLGRFEFVSRFLGGVESESTHLTPRSGNRFRNSWIGNLPAPLPAAYMRGIDIQKYDFESKMKSYFLGEWRDRGWWYYYLVGIWLKEPVALWLMVLIGFCAWGAAGFRTGSRTRTISRWIVLTPGIVLFVFVSSQTGFNHHLRYVLPFLPCFYLLVAAGTANVKGSGRLVIVALLAWYAISSVSMLPRSYAYFTEAIGGPSQGWRYLGDSNLDWGQDLLTAKQWIDANPEKRPVYLVYSIPELDFRKVGIDADDGRPMVTPHGPTQPGWWIVFARPMLDPENRWFREHPPTKRLSVTTSVFQITKEDLQVPQKSSAVEVAP
ncbi:MAG: glycosyltransferase family 39 protein [Planctomycetota bacterium]|jgi:4-amino-4-deoxy-L-arabinose transferase-like glycosyltransferase